MRKILLPLLALVALAMTEPAYSCWDGSGNCVRNNGAFTGAQVWQNSRDAGRKIRADDMDTHDELMATGVENTVARDGQNTPSANLPMGTFRHTGVGNAAARSDYAAAGQVQDDTFAFAAAASVGGTADAITLTPAPAITAYAAGQRFTFVAEAANTGATTINVSGVGAKSITKTGATALTAGDIADAALIQVVYDGTQFQLISTSGVAIGSGILTGDNTFTGSNTFSGTLNVTGTMQHAGATVLPIGAVQMYAGTTAPTGWHVLDGTAINRTTFANCFGVLGETFGAGNGSTTFNVPNMKGRMPIGVGQGATAAGGGTGTSRTLAADGGAETHTLTAAQSGSPVHSHPDNGASFVSASSISPGDRAGNNDQNVAPVGSTLSATTGNNAAQNAAQAHTIMNPFLAVNFIMFCPN